jgi:hypothetical protein
MKKILFALSLLLALSSCSSGVKYLGNKYPETENVKIFFSAADVDKPYEVIGKVYLDVEESTKDEKIQNMILNKAKANGGNAVIMGDLNVVRSGSVSGGTGASTRVGKKATIGGGTSKSKTTNNLRMEVTVIRYKENISN